ncbi:MAG: glycoside hydrolase family 43 protein [Acidobacteriota bacterium]|nr:glycoside hydrolase family 43 protein [Acidobacteriota bacterium]
MSQRILDASDVKWAKKAMWAPSVVKKGRKYYLFFSANDIKNDNEIGGIGVAVSDKPGGPFKDHLGQPLIGKFYHGAQPIDQFVFRDQDEQFYIIYGGWKHCNIGKLNKDFTAIVPFANGALFKEITPQNYVEGPMMFVRGGKYYFMWSEGNWTGPDYSVAYAVADSPFGPFQRVGKILQEDPAVATGAGHHSVMHDAARDYWYIVYHRRPLGEAAANNRVTCIERLYFDDKGLIQPVKLSFEGVPKQTLR